MINGLPIADTTIVDEDSVEPARAPSLEDVLTGDNVQAAWTRVRRNRGCAGVDGVGIAELEPIFSEQWQQTEEMIRSGTYRPQPLLRVRIPKPSGGERLLGIPTVMDRVVQQSIAQVLAPCWEPRFSPSSFAYRPGRGPRGALTAFEHAVNRGAQWVFHADIQDFFDSVPHPIALAALRYELVDPRLATLVRQTLSCGVYENGLVRPSLLGLPQGSPLSPLVANVVLDPLDRCLHETGWEFVRYADDCVILLPEKELESAARQSISQALARLGLRLNEKKTAFSHFTEARFLGFGFRPDQQGNAIRTVSSESLAEVEETLLNYVKSGASDGLRAATETARMLRSWLAYFYTPPDEAMLRSLADRIVGAWQSQYPGSPAPDCLRWENLQTGDPSHVRMDYNGHFDGQDAVDWTESVWCLLRRLLRARWWHLEYDLGWGRRRTGVRLYLGRHRISFRL